MRKKKSKILDLYAEGIYAKKDLDEKISEYKSQEEQLDRQMKEARKELQKIENLITRKVYCAS